ncbi:MAG: (d)CMP kinase [Lachnospiraceae bacterium]|nr:(d)CMP kinase [Lachnospiraceae bacterium]
MEKQAFNIAVDGPAGAGKSTIARMVAKELGFVYVDTGAMYRALALFCLQREISPEDEALVSSAVSKAGITIIYEEGVQQVILNGENVSGLIRTEQVGNTASTISAYPAVRAHLLNLQRDLAARTNVIMDGRDIGTCVLPKAQTKIYLTATPKVRALRRFKELKEKGVMCNLQEIEQDIIERDQKDMNRQIAPLKQAEDAVLVDGSDMTIEEVVSAIIRTAKLHGLVV